MRPSIASKAKRAWDIMNGYNHASKKQRKTIKINVSKGCNITV